MKSDYVEIRKGVYAPRNFVAPHERLDDNALRKLIRSMLAVLITVQREEEKLPTKQLVAR